MTTEVELKEIRSLLLELNKKVEGLNELLKKNLIGCEEPLPDEVEATKEHEAIADQPSFHRKESTKATSKVACGSAV